jgi:GNAT superfamily N-acetyltransferase
LKTPPRPVRSLREAPLTRCSTDIQGVVVVPEHRDKGIGSALVETACQHALQLGVGRVTVTPGRKVVPLYERLGFAPSRDLLQLA